MMKRRQWETWWDTAPETFPRDEGDMKRSHETHKLIAKLTAQVGGNVLDVGCASGLTYDYIKKTGVEYTGIDFEKKFLAHAREMHPEINVKHINAFNLPFADKSFKTVFCKSVLEHQHPDEYLEILSQMIRVAEKQVLIIWFNPPRDGKPVIQLYDGDKLYSNRYDRREVVGFIRKHKRFEKLRVIKNVGSYPHEVYVISLKAK